MERSTCLRLCRCATVALIVGGGLIASTQAQTPADRATNRGVVELVTDGDAASIAMAQDLAGIVDDGTTRRLLPVVGRGAVENLADLKMLRGIDMAIVQTDVLDYARQHGLPRLENSITYVAKLHTEELHVLARADVRRVGDLAGKKVDFVGTAKVTGPAVVDLLQLKVVPVFDDYPSATAKLKSGEVVAIVYVAAKPTPLFAALEAGGGLHFLSIPFPPALANAYVPAQLTAADYPRLVAADAPVDTVSVGMVLVVANLTPNAERYRNVANFVDAFFTLLPRLQEAPHHAKWSEVNVAAELSGWKRFPPADSWLQRNLVASAATTDEKEMREIFAKFLDERARSASGHTLAAEQKNQLFDQFMRWQSGRR
jgi:TRAP-type uncharacterized transport system substrate-binding protein